MDDDDIPHLLEQARKYRELGNAVRDRTTRLALLELAFEYEERAKRLMEDRGPGSVHEAAEAFPMVQGG